MRFDSDVFSGCDVIATQGVHVRVSRQQRLGQDLKGFGTETTRPRTRDHNGAQSNASILHTSKE